MEYYINKLYICNFKPFVYEEKTEKPYVTIDFSNGDNNIQSMILSGPNGYGKTSIFQAIYSFAVRNYRSRRICRWKKEECGAYYN